MLFAIPGAFHHFVGATKEALTTAKILLRGKAVVGVLLAAEQPEDCFLTEAAVSRDVSRSVVVLRFSASPGGDEHAVAAKLLGQEVDFR